MQAITEKTVTNYHGSFELENPIPTPTESMILETDGLMEKISHSQEKINKIPDASKDIKITNISKLHNSSQLLEKITSSTDLQEAKKKTALRKALEISDYEEISQLLKLGASLDDLSGKGITRILYENHLKTINCYDFDNLIDCLGLLYRNKKNDTSWINSSKIQLAFCIAQSTYTIYNNYLGNKFKENLLWLIRELLSSDICWNTEDTTGKTAYDYAKDCEYEELIKTIENIVKK